MSRRAQYNYPAPVKKGKRNLVVGSFIILAGIAYLIREINSHLLPDFLFSWQFVLIVIGILIGVYNQFKGNAWWILILIGSFFWAAPFLSDWFIDYNIHIRRLFLPIFLIILGGVMVMRSKRKSNVYYDYQTPVQETVQDSPFENVVNKNQEHKSLPLLDNMPLSDEDEKGSTQFAQEQVNVYEQQQSEESYTYSGNNVIKLNSYFGSNEETIISKNFMGGSINCAFGSLVLDLHQADFKNVVALEIFCMFGSVEVILPTNWSVKNETTALLGSTEDLRRNTNLNEPNKIIIVKGFVGLGSIEFRS